MLDIILAILPVFLLICLGYWLRARKVLEEGFWAQAEKITYLLFFLSWAPHHPMTARGRYLDTRSWKSKVGNIGSMGMQYHIVHHLHPYIPLTDTPAAYHEMRPLLVARGCDLGEN